VLRGGAAQHHAEHEQRPDEREWETESLAAARVAPGETDEIGSGGHG